MQLPDQGWQLSGLAAAQRDQIIRFWLSAPIDQLQPLWQSGFGEATRRLVQELTPQTPFNGEQVALRNAITQRIGSLGLTNPFAHQLLIAAFLLSPPGLFKVANPDQQLPAWLCAVYKELYESPSPVMVFGAAEPASVQSSAEVVSLPNPDFGAFPSSLEALVGNRIQLNRLLGLSNLYYIDPEDQEIKQELMLLRRSLAELIQQAPFSDLERIWATDFGDRYWALVRSGIQNEMLDPQDLAVRDDVTRILNPAQGGGFGAAGALNAFLISMMFYPPGAMRVEGAAQKLPAWVYEQYRQVFEQAQPIGV